MKNLLFFISIFFLGIQVSIAQWVSTGGPKSGPNHCLAINDKNIFLGTWSPGGIYRSTDNGLNWALLNIGVPDPYVNAITINDSKILAAIYGGVYRSTDNGTNWTQASSGLTNTEVVSLVVSDTNLFCGTYAGVYRSTNNGTSWIAVNNGFPSGVRIFIVKSLSVIGINIFAGTDGYGVFRSKDNGANWKEMNTGLTDLRVECLATIGNNLFAGTFQGVYRSSDYGETWIKTTGFAGKIVNTLAVSGNNIFGGSSTGDIRVSTDIGSTWTGVSTGMNNEMVYTLAAGGTNMFAGTLEGLVYRRELAEMIPVLEVLPNRFLSVSHLEQNYPNPFNSSTTINWHSTESSWQTLKVYDFLGHEVATLVDEFKPAGDYEINLNASGLSKGVYFYKLHAGRFNSTKKMIVIK